MQSFCKTQCWIALETSCNSSAGAAQPSKCCERSASEILKMQPLGKQEVQDGKPWGRHCPVPPWLLC